MEKSCIQEQGQTDISAFTWYVEVNWFQIISEKTTDVCAIDIPIQLLKISVVKEGDFKSPTPHFADRLNFKEKKYNTM